VAEVSREYLILIVDEPPDGKDVDGATAEIFMRFTEEPTEGFIERVARLHPGRRVYSLLGASSWQSIDKPPPPEHRCVAGRIGDDIYVCDVCGKDMST
jgi:hypothetical protein